MDRAPLRRLLYRRGWDTRCRNLAAARILHKAIAELPPQHGPVLLDVGCGSAGVAAFLPDVAVVGVDLEEPHATPPNLIFKAGSITDLRFGSGAFPFVSCVDVLEHLAPGIRSQAIGEMVRVASHGVLIACPHGENAARCDVGFRRALEARARPIPGWLLEHEAYPFPTVQAVVESLRQADEGARISVSYSEPLDICRIVRGAAARSDVLYAVSNLLFGALLGLVPVPRAGTSYRMVVFAELAPGHSARTGDSL